MGKRETWRKCRVTVDRILELNDKGLSTSAIASAIGMREEFVVGILERAQEKAHEVLEGEGVPS